MICGIVLAAGYSSRMGTQKLLLPFGKSSIISHITSQLLESKVTNIYVVVGHEPEQIAKELSGKPITIIHNPEYKTGMLSSVRAGIRDINKECDAILVTLGDQPSITANLINKMFHEFSITDKKIIVPAYNSRRGHPIIFSSIFKNEILTNYDDIGLRGLLRTHENDIYEMDVTDDSIISDMDYPEDYQREVKRLEDENK